MTGRLQAASASRAVGLLLLCVVRIPQPTARLMIMKRVSCRPVVGARDRGVRPLGCADGLLGMAREHVATRRADMTSAPAAGKRELKTLGAVQHAETRAEDALSQRQADLDSLRAQRD